MQYGQLIYVTCELFWVSVASVTGSNLTHYSAGVLVARLQMNRAAQHGWKEPPWSVLRLKGLGVKGAQDPNLGEKREN